MVNKIKLLFYISLSVVLLGACNSNEITHKKGKAFQYSIQYLVAPEDNPIVSLMPEQMEVFYCDSSIYYYTEGWMGLFTSSQILNIKDSTRTLLAKFLDKKFAHTQLFKEYPLKFEAIKPFEMCGLPTDTVFQGYKAKKQWISYDGSDTNRIYIIYTYEFEVDNPNIGSPMKAVDGILLRFPMSMMNIPMMVELKSAKDTLLNDSVFNIPSDYLIVDRNQIEKIFDEFAPK
ncbi:MAG: hypothetical protein PHU27_04525 [Salinivirgaceae bacterium]|nr:hypothetical protein [Salinivirgaceae bacterium]